MLKVYFLPKLCLKGTVYLKSLNEHNHKCHDKILAGDFSGAITNSRSLLEKFYVKLSYQFTKKKIREEDNQDIMELLKS